MIEQTREIVRSFNHIYGEVLVDPDVLLPDNRAHGESEGKCIGFGWLDKDDCLAWAAEAQKRLPGGRFPRGGERAPFGGYPQC